MTPSSRAPAGDAFDEIDLAHLRSRAGVKWSAAVAAGPDVLPAWVADMDYPPASVVGEALAGLAAGGDLGYGPPDETALVEERWAGRMASRFGWSPGPGLTTLFTDLVQAAQILLQLASGPGDGVLLLTPSYPPFVQSLDELGRRLVAVPAVEAVPPTASAEGGWVFDWDEAWAGAGRAAAKVMLLVNPHNPTGRLLTREELEAAAELAEHHGLIVVSDEVHAELALTDRRHIPFASLGPEVAARTVTLYSASKAFNLGGMCCALAHVGPPELRRRLAAMPSHLRGRTSRAAIATTLAAWSPEGDAWLGRCLERLRDNRRLLGAWLSGAGGGAGVAGHLPEATYLAWLNFAGTALGADPAAWLLDNARVMLSSGPSFGPGGSGFARLNFATTPAILASVLDRVSTALAAPGLAREAAAWEAGHDDKS